MDAEKLPVPVLEHPRWRVAFRPLRYDPKRIGTLNECVRIIEQSKLRLRGWDYPHLSLKKPQRPHGNDWVGSWANTWGHVEYWRFYQSGQFLHLFAVREAIEETWAAQLQDAMRWHVGSGDPELAQVRGFFSLENFVYTVTEVFEFAARLAEKSVYEEGVTISIRLLEADGFALTPGSERAWSEVRLLSEPDIGTEWTLSSPELLSSSAEHSHAAITWFFERFGWLSPNIDVIRKDQEKFLKGLL